MADSIDTESEKRNSVYNTLSLESYNNKLLLDFNSSGNLSEAEIKFLTLSKEKKNSAKIIQAILSEKITPNNYEKIFCLEKYEAHVGTINPQQDVRSIRYKDSNGVIVATVQIDTVNNKIRVQNFGDILPKQEAFTPTEIGIKLEKMANFNAWKKEDGGINQFNGNMEYRYKDDKGRVMAAIITKPDNSFDTIAEYEYNSKGFRTQMLLTNQYGQSKVIYDGSASVTQVTRIDIDNDGVIVEITKLLNI